MGIVRQGRRTGPERTRHLMGNRTFTCAGAVKAKEGFDGGLVRGRSR